MPPTLIDHIYIARNGKKVKIVTETLTSYEGQPEGEKLYRTYDKNLLNDKHDTQYDLIERITGKDYRKG